MEELTENVVHYPSLKTVLAIEDAIKASNVPLSRNQILAKLPTKVMRSTLNLALTYMERRGLVLETGRGFVWTYGSKMNSDNVNNDISRIKKQAIPVLKANGVKRAAIFGSVARGEATARSDVDFLVEFDKKAPTLFDLGGLVGELERKLKRAVDVVLFGSIDTRIKQRILNEKVDIL